MVLGGTDRKAVLCTRSGTVLATIAAREGWVWCVRAHPKQNYVAVGADDGSITLYQLVFSTVHGLYRERYAFRWAQGLPDALAKALKGPENGDRYPGLREAAQLLRRVQAGAPLENSWALQGTVHILQPQRHAQGELRSPLVF